MVKIVVVAMALAFPNEKGPERFYYIANLLKEHGFDVTLITGSYQHWERRQRDAETIRSSVKFHLAQQPSYSKTVCFRRIYSLRVYQKNVVQQVKKINPDVIYCSIPDNMTAAKLASYAKKNNKRIILDIEDLWPEGMKMAINKYAWGKFAGCFLIPFKIAAKTAYDFADAFVGTSEEYTFIPNKYNSKNREKRHEVVYVGCDISKFDNACKECQTNIEEKKAFWATYAGTIGISYDIKTLVETAVILENAGYSDIEFKILGDGPLKAELEEYAKKKACRVNFLGYVNYERMAAYLKASDVVINSFIKGAPQSIVTKIGDYLASGSPIINTLENEEFSNLVKTERIGINVEAENPEALADVILQLYHDEELKKRMGINARNLALEQFDRKNSYLKIVEIIHELERI